jgi:hypothetical protein
VHGSNPKTPIAGGALSNTPPVPARSPAVQTAAIVRDIWRGQTTSAPHFRSLRLDENA